MTSAITRSLANRMANSAPLAVLVCSLSHLWLDRASLAPPCRGNFGATFRSGSTQLERRWGASLERPASACLVGRNPLSTAGNGELSLGPPLIPDMNMLTQDRRGKHPSACCVDFDQAARCLPNSPLHGDCGIEGVPQQRDVPLSPWSV